MKKYRIIFHVDLNAFFASCEEAQDPSLKDKPIGIGKNSDRGILTTANYAARKYGVTSAMNVFEAKRRCPHLLVVPGNMALYQEYSQKFFEYLRTITSMVEPASIDEAYLDVTNDLNDLHPLDLAKKIQKDLLDTLKLPVSIGIAPNRFLAKMASDMKKPLGVTVLRKRDIEEKLWPLKIGSMYGIGKKTVPNLRLIGIETIGDLANFKDHEKLSKFLGNQTEGFLAKAWGESTAMVDPTRAETVHSVGNSKTFEGFLHSYEAMLAALTKLTETVVSRLHKKSYAAKSISVQVRYADFSQRSKQVALPQHSNDFDEILEMVEHLFEDLYEEKAVHLLGVSSSNLEKQEMLFKQLNIFEPKEAMEKDTHLTRVLDSINKNYKKPLLKRGLKK